jgi:hypothetical protein
MIGEGQLSVRPLVARTSRAIDRWLFALATGSRFDEPGDLCFGDPDASFADSNELNLAPTKQIV